MIYIIISRNEELAKRKSLLLKKEIGVGIISNYPSYIFVLQKIKRNIGYQSS